MTSVSRCEIVPCLAAEPKVKSLERRIRDRKEIQTGPLLCQHKKGGGAGKKVTGSVLLSLGAAAGVLCDDSRPKTIQPNSFFYWSPLGFCRSHHHSTSEALSHTQKLGTFRSFPMAAKVRIKNRRIYGTNVCKHPPK